MIPKEQKNEKRILPSRVYTKSNFTIFVDTLTNVILLLIIWRIAGYIILKKKFTYQNKHFPKEDHLASRGVRFSHSIRTK